MSENANGSICGFLEKNCTPIDNIPEDIQKRDRICMEARASLLIEANCTGERFPAFMKCGTREPHGWVYPFSSLCRMNFTDHSGRPFTWWFEKFIVLSGKSRMDSPVSSCSRWQPYVTGDNFSLHILERDQLYGATADWNQHFSRYFRQAQEEFDRQYRSRFRLCQERSPYKTPEQVCRFFGNRGEVFARLKCGGMHPDCFPENSSACIAGDQNRQNSTEVQLIQVYLQELCPCSALNTKEPVLSHKYYDNWFCQVFPFRNEYGEIRMQLIKLYDPETQMKCLIPVTSWMRDNFPYSQLFCIPLPEDKQPLYNLDLLLSPECKTVILTDSVELADSSQRNASDGIVFTSFLCSPGRYEQVDWSPLHGRQVICLITNHSGIRLEDAALKARELKKCLDDMESEIELTFVVVPVDYHAGELSGRQDFSSVDDILSRYQQQSPAVRSTGVRLLESEEDFQSFCRNAENAVNARSREWWEENASGGGQQHPAEQESKAPQAIDYVMHPLLIRGEATMLYAHKSVGKSALAYSIAARVVAAGFSTRPVPLLPEKWWTVPQKKHKVLYLDFENQAQIGRKRQLFQDSYFPQAKLAECRANLIMKDLSTSQKNFSSPANHQEVLNMIDAAKNEGTPDLPVDLLVIDTYTRFVGTENPSTPNDFIQLINRIRRMGIAVLIVHHTNSSGEIRGMRNKQDILTFKFKLSRENDVTGDLETSPLTVTYEEIRHEMGNKLREPFKICYSNNNHQWHVVEPVRTENAELKLIYDGYRGHGYCRDAICNMIGLKKSALSERLKEKNK